MWDHCAISCDDVDNGGQIGEGSADYSLYISSDICDDLEEEKIFVTSSLGTFYLYIMNTI